MRQLALFLLISLFTVHYTNGQVQSIKNGPTWYDTDGNEMQAHSPAVLLHEGVYYMIGADRTTGSFTGLNLYASTDLMNWEFKHRIVNKNTNEDLKSGGVQCRRPNLIYNKTTKKFVIWCKYVNRDLVLDEVAIFTCDKIDGDYTFVKSYKPLGYGTNDCSTFVDDDGTGYFTSSNKENNSINIYKMTKDYLDVNQVIILFEEKHREAPVLFKNNGYYYIMSSYKSGWDPNPLRYAKSTSVMSGWGDLTTIADRMTYDSQGSHYAQVIGTQGTSTFFLSDRWKDPGNTDAKVLMFPLSFKDNGNMDISYVYEYKIDMKKGTWSAFDDNNYISQNNWNVVSSTGGITGTNTADKAIDNNLNTFWMTSGTVQHPHEIVIDLGSREYVNGLKYVQRMDDDYRGMVQTFELYLSNDLNNWGDPVSEGRISYTAERFFETKNARYMKFVSLSEISRWDPVNYTAASELKLMFESNLDFEADHADTQTPIGWISEGDVSADYINNSNAQSGNYKLLHKGQGAYTVKTFQTVPFLENGTYVLSAWVKSSGGQNTSQMYARRYGSGILSTDIPATNEWTQIKVTDIEVTNGQCQIGFESDAQAGQWINIDNVSFELQTGCEIIPYLNVNNQGWNQQELVDAQEGDRVWFGPQSSVTGAANTSGWSWTGPNGFITTGRSLLIEDIQEEQAGEYIVTNTDDNACPSQSTFTVKVDATVTSLPKTSIESNIALYPNPTTNSVNLSSETDWILMDVLGKVQSKGTGQQLDLSEYASGVYFIIINNHSHKVIKE